MFLFDYLVDLKGHKDTSRGLVLNIIKIIKSWGIVDLQCLGIQQSDFVIHIYICEYVYVCMYSFSDSSLL